MKPSEITGELDTIHFLLSASSRSILHTHIYLTEGPHEPTEEDYHALYAVFDFQSELLKRMQKCIDELAAAQIAGVQSPDAETADN